MTAAPKIMGMILAAGMGTRLGALSHDRPKALLPLGQTTLLEQAVRKLLAHGVRDIVINVHHHADQVREYLEKNKHFGASIEISGEEDLLLDTGGGIFHASSFLSKARHFFVYNVDVVSSIDLGAMLKQHLSSGALATLAVRERTSSRYLLFDAENRLRAWKDMRTGETIGAYSDHLHPLAFSGIHLVSADIFRLYQAKHEPFSIIPVYIHLAATYQILSLRHDQDTWMDVGDPSRIQAATEWLGEHMPRVTS